MKSQVHPLNRHELDDCGVCDKHESMSHYDSDLKKLVCNECVDHLVVAEKALRMAHLISPEAR